MNRDEASEPFREPGGRAPSALGDLLAALSRRAGWSRRLEGARVHERWEEIAGPQTARHAEPVRLHGGVLVLHVDTPVWATQLRYLAPQIVDRANEVLGPGQVERVAIVSGPRGGRREV